KERDSEDLHSDGRTGKGFGACASGTARSRGIREAESVSGNARLSDRVGGEQGHHDPPTAPNIVWLEHGEDQPGAAEQRRRESRRKSVGQPGGATGARQRREEQGARPKRCRSL